MEEGQCCSQLIKKITSEKLKTSGKIFERLIYYFIYDFLSDNNLLSPNQSEFRSSGSCLNQLLFNNHEILISFDKGLEASGIFLDISKTFNKLWRDGFVKMV